MRVSVAPNARWRSARRRSNEKSAKQIRRELQRATQAEPRWSDVEAVLTHPQQIAGRLRTPPPWLVKGAIVDYHDGTSSPPILSCTVVTQPFQINDQWCALLDKKRGWVPIEALTQAATTTK